MVKIAGIQKMTLLDFPGKVACTIFLPGCNFRCPYCHNSDLLEGCCEYVMDEAEFLSFLRKRTGLLEGVCVSGGEPTLQPELENFLRQIKALGFPIKLDTNGSRPEILKHLVEAGLVDYVAMDIKNSPVLYAATTGSSHIRLADIEQSIAFLSSGAVAHEFRTTVVSQLHSAESILEMGRWLLETSSGHGIKKLFLQPFVDRDTVVFSGLQAPESTQLTRYTELLRPFVQEVFVRG